MIYTVTFNPSLDYVVQVEDFKDDAVNRTLSEHVYAGGKGNNVAVVISNLGLKSRALGFRAGFTGIAMEQMLREYGCDTDFIPLDEGMTRINVKVKSETSKKQASGKQDHNKAKDQEFEINGQGPQIPQEKISQLFDRLDALEKEDVLVLSGSIPNTLPDDIYEQIMKRLDKIGVRIAVDATQKLLLNVLKYHPFLIKPNNHELGEMFGVTLTSDEQVIEYAKKLQEMGARNVLVSMAGDGAILVDEHKEVWKRLPPKGTVVNSVGAGDSMVAGFLAGYLTTGSYEKALLYGTAAGSATAFTSWLAGRAKIDALLESLAGQ
ncbi:MAG: 1-phosphofructokinase [Eubacterium sp.]|nr:1-phosphofructokinase [Eubacterium sp.]